MRTRPILVAGEYDAYKRFRSKLKWCLISCRGNKCEECGRDFQTQKLAYKSLYVHHIESKAQGGPDDDDNLILVCFDCHQAKHTFDIREDNFRVVRNLKKVDPEFLLQDVISEWLQLKEWLSNNDL